MMKNLRFYIYATWGLLILNLTMVAFFFLTAPPPSQGTHKRGEKAVDILKLDKQQDESFILLATQHMQQMDDFNDEQRNLLKPYFNTLIDQSKSVDSDIILNQIQSLERKKIESTYQHFQEVKTILNPSQHLDYEYFIEHAIRKILIDQKKNPPPPKDSE